MQLGRGAADGEALRSGLLGLARVALLVGDLTAAQGWAAEARVVAERCDDIDDTAIALGYLGDVARRRGLWDRARSLHTDSLRLAREGGLHMGVARGLLFRAWLAESEGDPEAAVLFENALAVAQVGDIPAFHEIRCRLGIGNAAAAGDDLATAACHLLEALDRAEGIGDIVGSAEALRSLGIVARRRGRIDEAGTLGRRSLELFHRAGAIACVASSLEALAGLASGNRPEVAARLLAAAQVLRDPQNHVRTRPDQDRYEADLARIRSALTSGVFAAASAEGARLSADEAVAYALRGRRTTDRLTTGWDSLTTAEKEVVRLVSQGLTNPEVGRRLFISPRTVGHHLSHVFDKVGVRSRGALIKELAGRPL